jgi:hypothetical protein
MIDPTLEDLARRSAAGDGAAAEALLGRFREVFRLLKGDLLDRVAHSALSLKAHADQAPPAPSEPGCPFPRTQLSPELLEWARQQFNEEELEANLREVREKGGLELKDFIHELEQIVNGREPTR